MTPLTIRNDLPIVGWVFGGAWIGGLLMFSYIYARDGGFGQFDPAIEAGVMMLFWVFGLVLLSQTLPLACSRLSVSRGGATLTRQWMWKRRTLSLKPAVLRAMEIRQDRDSDGDPYFKLVLTVGPHDETVISESSDRERVETVRADILSRL